ncbi:hypothetical protein [Caldanaerobius polysaccharolyticus]|uniref:hypothetical protein n=1 Tax=Caldanaerobius polysaccharolyticus TaxID=44256 RepID=UPI00047AF1D8|nr:hypothetical protein [Caldanaerobius polysaccharolyticus]
MRSKRAAVQSRKAQVKALSFILFLLMPFFVLVTGYFLAIYAVVPLLNSRQDNAKAPFQYTYDIPSITFFSVEFEKDGLAVASFNNIYHREYDGRYWVGVFLKESDARDVLKKVNQKGLNAKIYALKYDRFSLSYSGDNHGEIKVIQKYINDFQKLLVAQSEVLCQYAVNKIDDNAFASSLNEIKGRFNSIENSVASYQTKDVAFTRIKDSIMAVSKINISAIDRSTVSLNLKDGNAYKILEDAYIQSIDVYKNMMENISK